MQCGTQACQAGSRTAQTYKGHAYMCTAVQKCRERLQVSTYQLEAQYCASTSQNDPGTIRMCRAHAQNSNIPTDTPEPVRTPQNSSKCHTHLVEVQNCTQRSQRGSDMSGTRTHVQSVQVDMIMTEKNSRRHQHSPQQAEGAKVTCLHEDVVHRRGGWSGERCGCVDRTYQCAVC